MSDIALSMLLLCIIAALGLGLGAIKVKGISLGVGGVLFSGIAVGHIAEQVGIQPNLAPLVFLQDFGLILFVYTIGIQVGPGFFASLKRSGLTPLAFANGLAPCEAPSLAYATIYPLVMCLRILAPQILVMILARFAA